MRFGRRRGSTPPQVALSKCSRMALISCSVPILAARSCAPQVWQVCAAHTVGRRNNRSNSPFLPDPENRSRPGFRVKATGKEMERRVTELPEGGSAMRSPDEMERPTPHRETPRRGLSRWCPSRRQGDEGVRSQIGTIGDLAQVRHYNQAENHRSAGKLMGSSGFSARAGIILTQVHV